MARRDYKALLGGLLTGFLIINFDKKSGYETILLNLFVSLIFPGNNL